MTYQLVPVSNHSYAVSLKPTSPAEALLLFENSDDAAIVNFYRHAIKMHLDHADVSALTPNADYPYSATVDLYSVDEDE